MLAGRVGAVRREAERVGEGLDQADLGDHRLPVGADHRRAVRVELEHRHVLVQHRVAEAVDRVGELGGDRRIEVDVGVAEQVDGRRDLARELLEHEVLVLRLGAELGGLEQALAVPFVVLDAVRQVARPAAPSSAANDTSPLASSPRTRSLICSTRRLCSSWKIVVHRGQRRCSR